jgi:glutamate dehydrogenase (NAD(P)+)
MAWVMDTYSMHVGHTTTSVVTGKPVELGGSLGRREATGRGVMIATREAAKHVGIDITKAASRVAGLRQRRLDFGAAARPARRARSSPSPTGRAASTTKRIDVEQLIAHVQQHRTVHGFSGAEPLANGSCSASTCDILIPAALENQITKDNAPTIKARIIVEGANGPTTPDAHRHLHERGVFVVPDILANSSGVTTSYFEWVQDRYGYFWTEKEVNERLELKMCEAFDAVLRPRSSTPSTCAPPPTSSPSTASRQ